MLTNKTHVMKRTKSLIQTIESRFKKEKLERNQMQYLIGGDGDGSQGGVNDPWGTGGGG